MRELPERCAVSPETEEQLEVLARMTDEELLAWAHVRGIDVCAVVAAQRTLIAVALMRARGECKRHDESVKSQPGVAFFQGSKL
jgi:hypothetical protein